jgi:rhamnosyltransferase
MYDLKDKIYALITLFKPSEQNAEKIKDLSKYVDKVFLCDNSGKSNEELFSSIDNSVYIDNGANLGLSTAYNTVLKNVDYGLNADDFIIFFDQDSSITYNHIEKLLSVYRTLEKKIDKIGCLGPAYYNCANDQIEVVKGKKIFDRTYEVSKIITSSMLTKYSTLKEVGFFNDSVFLDYADWDLCWRLEKRGFRCFITSDTSIEHCVGIGEKKIGFISIRIWNPIRTYYQVRDGKYLLKQDYVPFIDKLHLLYMTKILPVLNIRYFDRKEEREKYYEQALMDAKNNVIGEFK